MNFREKVQADCTGQECMLKCGSRSAVKSEDKSAGRSRSKTKAAEAHASSMPHSPAPQPVQLPSAITITLTDVVGQDFEIPV